MQHILLTLLLIASAQFSSATEIVTYYVNDALGSPVMALDEAGDVVWQESYQPYGQRQIKSTAASSDEQFYTGKQEEPDIGLQYYGARWYDPESGRFTSIDPVGVQEGNIHSFNRYAYANNNPYRFVDPDGMLSWPVNKNADEKVVLTSSYGPRNTGIQGASINHNGQDFRAGKGAEILAPQDGKVKAIIPGSKGGNAILVQNADGSMNGFAHTKATKKLKVGSSVSEGSVIGHSDGSGTGNAPHLHLTYRPGSVKKPATVSTSAVDPMKTQFKDMPKNGICVKSSQNSC